MQCGGVAESDCTKPRLVFVYFELFNDRLDQINDDVKTFFANTSRCINSETDIVHPTAAWRKIKKVGFAIPSVIREISQIKASNWTLVNLHQDDRD